MQRIYKSVKKIIPRISYSELIALQDNTICIDKDIFLGKVNTEHINDSLLAKKVSELSIVLTKIASYKPILK